MSKSITRPDKPPHAALQKSSLLRNISICLQSGNFLRLACGASTASHNDHSCNIRAKAGIKEHEIRKTIPVQADIGESRMRFFVGSRDAGKQLESSDNVRVMRLPERTVLSLGGGGATPIPPGVRPLMWWYRRWLASDRADALPPPNHCRRGKKEGSMLASFLR
jgi:hypothetical protein